MRCSTASYRPLASAALALALSIFSSALSAQQITKNPVPGVTNFARLETTVACAGATTPEAMPAIKQMGFVSVINLREASENGANVDAEAAAAKAAGLKYFHVPFNGSTPSPQAIEQFLDAITSKGSEPAFIHCSGGNRAASMWLVKRIAVDHWDTDRAVAEANALGLVNPVLRQFMVDYALAHKR